MPKIRPFEKYTDQYENWFEKNRYVYQSEINAIRVILPDFKNGIEIGVGSGRFAKPLGIKFGVEPSYEMRKIAQSRGIEVVDSVAEKLPFKDCIFDLALMVTTLCFLDDERKAFIEIYRILKPGGYFINGFVDKNSRVGRIYQKNKKKSVFYREAIFFTTEEVVKLLEKTGFKDFEFRQTVFSTLDKINQVEKIKEGYGEGSFVVIKAQK
ncbi:MAG: class I SAM-dependent methyltransferase [Actinobacteria bacterium]|nr:class I SAM-dependent methyltransferase [Actinomycetota bacterium]MBL7124426.1 class I SAM-dependent methyltransferase [Actinomycetota bacterium]